MTIFGLASLVLLALAGVSIYLAILAGAIVILVVGNHQDAAQVITVMFNRLDNFNLLAVPLFVVLGQILAYGGAGKALMKMLNAFMGHIPGGPAYAVILGSVMVAAMCSSPVASIAAFGPVTIPILVGMGYTEMFSIGLVVSSSILAPLIPPSAIAIIYSYIAQPYTTQDVSVDRLWAASIMPGILIAFLLCVTVFIYSRRGHYKRLPPFSWTERWASLKEGWLIAITPFVVLLPLYTGQASPTEVAAIGVIYVAVISVFFYKGLNLNTFWQSCVSTVRVVGVLFLIVAAAVLLSVAVTFAQLPQDVTQFIADMNLNWWLFILMMIVLYTFMGMFMDPMAIVLISTPMLIPSIVDLGIDAVAYGVFTIIAVNLAGVTPPYGLNLFAAQSILNKPYAFIVRSVMIFLPAIFLGFIISAFVPQLSTWIANTLVGK